jgi:hypothetical protein
VYDEGDYSVVTVIDVPPGDYYFKGKADWDSLRKAFADVGTAFKKDASKRYSVIIGDGGTEWVLPTDAPWKGKVRTEEEQKEFIREELEARRKRTERELEEVREQMRRKSWSNTWGRAVVPTKHFKRRG